MSREKKSRVSPVLSRALLSALCVLLTGALSLSVYAWVVRNRHVYNGFEMQINDNVVSAISFTAYKFDHESDQAIIVTGEDIILPQYDSVFIERNDKIALVFKSPVSGASIDAGETFTVTLDLQDLSSVTGLSDHNWLDGDKTPGSPDSTIADYVSNICYVACGIIPTLQENTAITDTTEIYNTAVAWFASNGERHTFFEGSNGAKTGEITFTFSGYTPPPSGTRVLNVWIEIGYDPGLVTEMTLSRGILLDSDSLLDNAIDIDSDLGSFLFEVFED